MSDEHDPQRCTAGPTRMLGNLGRNSCMQIVSPNGIVVTRVKTIPMAMIGASVKSSLSAFGGMKSSLVKNFSPSAAGCSRPARRNSLPNTLMTARFGPIRSWIIELWRRSAHVRMAARFRTNIAMIRILTIVHTSWLRVIALVRFWRCWSLGVRFLGWGRHRRRRGFDLRRAEKLRADLFHLPPRGLVAQDRGHIGQLAPRGSRGALRLQRLFADL